MIETEEAPLISFRQAAEALGITESSAYRWLAAGELPGSSLVRSA